MMKYSVRYINDRDPGSYCIIGFADTIEDAAKLRLVSGDLVYDNKTGEVETSSKWLWNWEVADKTSYAMSKVSNSCKVQNLSTDHL